MGRGINSGLVKLRAKVWHALVFNHFPDLSNGQIDVLFDKEKRAGHERVRKFHRYEQGTHPRRFSEDLQAKNYIDPVDFAQSQYGCIDSKTIYESPFWDLLEAHPSDRNINKNLIIQLSHLCQMDLPLLIKTKPIMFRGRLDDDAYLFKCHKGIHPINTLAISGVIYREYFQSMNPIFARMAEKDFKKYLTNFLNLEWLSDHLKDEITFFSKARVLLSLAEVQEYEPSLILKRKEDRWIPRG